MKNTNKKRNKIRRKMNPQYPNLWKYRVCRCKSYRMILSFRFWALFDYWIIPTCHVPSPPPPPFVNMTELLTTVIQVGGLTRRRIQKGKSTKTDKTDKKLNHLSFQSTEQLKNNTFLTWYRHFPRKMVGMTKLLTTVIQVGGLTRRKTWFNPPFSREMPVPSREYDSCSIL
jgi:hypothetical protein